MAMGTRKQRQPREELWYRRDLVEAPGHPFYRRLNEVLRQPGFDEFCEARCRKFYHEKLGRPSLAPGMYFRTHRAGESKRDRLRNGMKNGDAFKMARNES
jgi:hypothetical protein